MLILFALVQIYSVIENIQSRQTIIKINTLNKENIETIFNKVKEKEKLKIQDDAKETILNLSNNSVSIMLNYMDKCRLIKKNITNDIAEKICTDISYKLFDNYTNLILLKMSVGDTKDSNIKKAIDIMYGIYENGYSVIDILDNYFTYIKNNKTINDKTKFIITKLLCKYISIFYEVHEERIELALFTNNLFNKLNSKK